MLPVPDPQTHDHAPPGWLPTFAAWLVAGGATLGAIFLGEIMGLPICSLCWYQRSAMFPLAVLLPFALFPFNRSLLRPALVFALIGLALAIFHQSLVAGLIPADLQPCRQGVPCSETVIRWFDVVTIPLLSILAFSLLAALLAIALRRSTP